MLINFLPAVGPRRSRRFTGVSKKPLKIPLRAVFLARSGMNAAVRLPGRPARVRSKPPTPISSLLRNFHQHHSVSRNGSFEVVREFSEILLAPQIANLPLSRQAQVRPGSFHCGLLFAQVEQPDCF